MNTPSSINNIPKELVNSINQIHSPEVRRAFFQMLENIHYRNNNHKSI